MENGVGLVEAPVKTAFPFDLSVLTVAGGPQRGGMQLALRV